MLSFELWFFVSSFVLLFYFVILIFHAFPQSLAAPLFLSQLLSFLCVYWEDFAVFWLRGSCETCSWLFRFLRGSGHFPAGTNSVNKIAGSSRNREKQQQSSMSLWLSPGRCSQCVGTRFFQSFHLLEELEWAALCLALQSCRLWKNPTSNLLGLQMAS